MLFVVITKLPVISLQYAPIIVSRNILVRTARLMSEGLDDIEILVGLHGPLDEVLVALFHISRVPLVLSTVVAFAVSKGFGGCVGVTLFQIPLVHLAVGMVRFSAFEVFGGCLFAVVLDDAILFGCPLQFLDGYFVLLNEESLSRKFSSKVLLLLGKHFEKVMVDGVLCFEFDADRLQLLAKFFDGELLIVGIGSVAVLRLVDGAVEVLLSVHFSEDSEEDLLLSPNFLGTLLVISTLQLLLGA